MNNKYASGRAERFQPKKYSRLTGQLIRNGIKKKIFDIRKRKTAAVNELLDDLEKKLKQNASKQGVENGRKSEKINKPEQKRSEQPQNYDENAKKYNENAKIYDEIAETIAEGIALADKLKGKADATEININDLLLQILSASRQDWGRFLQTLADNCDAEAFACFGTNLIYGGFLTETAGNAPRCSLVRLSGSSSCEKAEKLQNIVKQDSLAGRRVCIIIGKGLLSRELMEIYRHFGETAFILLDEEGGIPEVCDLYNALYITDSRVGLSRIPPKTTPICGIISINDIKGASERQVKSEGMRPLTGSLREENNKNGEGSAAALGGEEVSSVARRSLTSEGEKGTSVARRRLPSEGEDRSRERRTVTSGREGGARLTYGGLTDSPYRVSSLFKLLTSPELPIDLSFSEFYGLICELERLLSEGRNDRPLTVDI